MNETLVFAALSFLIVWTGATIGVVLWIVGALQRRVDTTEYERRHQELQDLLERRHTQQQGDIDRARARLEHLERWAIRLNGRIPISFEEITARDDLATPPL